ncbi:MAG TPA: AtpZ/AtpI family protein [Bacteroidota bacterium]|nr:AtpZ/AtpI family protein [Bacteroidota bacterium]HRT67418.1 AtpZ/AtpI family protein [Bacteroidota bacterium]
MQNNKDNKENNSVWKSAGPFLNLGTELVTPIILGGLIGSWLDKKNGTKFWLIILLIVGIIVGFYNFFRTIKRYNKD